MSEYSKEWPFNNKEENFIQSLGEARMFKTREQISREGLRAVTDHLFIGLLSLYAMSNDYNYAPVASGYAQQTLRQGNFNNPSPSGTDLYQTIYTLKRADTLFTNSKDLLLASKLNLEEPKIKQFLRQLQSGNVNSQAAGQFFFRLERTLQIQDPKLRAARRLIQDWPTLTTQQQQLAVTQVVKHFRIHGNRSDLMPLVVRFAKDGNFLLSSGKLSSIAKKTAEYAAYGAAGYALGRMVGF